MRVLVTGATTDTGRRLCERLIAQRHHVVAFGGSGRERSTSEAGGALGGGVEHVAGRLPEPLEPWGDSGGHFDRAAEGAPLVFHLAHIRYAPSVVERARALGALRVVCVSSARRFTQRPDEAARQVIIAEEALASEPTGWVALRATMIYGGGHDRNIARLVRMVRTWPVIPLPGGGRNRVQPLFVDDLVEGLLAAGHAHDVAGKVIDVAGPDALTQREVFEAVARLLNKRPLFVPLPLAPARVASRLAGSALRDRIRRLGEDRTADIEQARAMLNFQPRSFDVGLRNAGFDH